MKKKTGIELIAEERQEQIEKHGRSIEQDVKLNHGHYEENGEVFNNPQLTHAAGQLIHPDDSVFRQLFEAGIFMPHRWDKNIWVKMMKKPYKERLIIAGALIAAEIDRIQNETKTPNP